MVWRQSVPCGRGRHASAESASVSSDCLGAAPIAAGSERRKQRSSSNPQPCLPEQRKHGKLWAVPAT